VKRWRTVVTWGIMGALLSRIEVEPPILPEAISLFQSF
jgi:hypothetical protein